MPLARRALLVLCLGSAACALGLDGYTGGPTTAAPSGDGGLEEASVITLPDGAVVEAGATDSGSDANTPATSTIAFVQAKSDENDGTTLKLALGAPVKAHDTLIVGLNADSNSTAKTVTDSLNNTFTRIAGAESIFDLNAYLYVAYDTFGGNTDTITITVDGDPTITTIQGTVVEYAGLLANGLDIAGTAGDPSGGKAESLDLQTTKSNVLLFGYSFAGTDDGDGTVVAGANFVGHVSDTGQLAEDRLVAGPGKQTITATMTTGNGWVLLGAAFAGQ